MDQFAENLKNKCKKFFEPQPSCDQRLEFFEIVKEYLNMSTDNKKEKTAAIANECCCIISTVTRWANGKAFPLKSVQCFVVGYIMDHV